jgi:hypothetical protein
VEDGPKRIALCGKRTYDDKTLRIGPWIKERMLVAIYNEEAKMYHEYITNIPIEGLDAEDIAVCIQPDGKLSRFSVGTELIFINLCNFFF